MNKKIAKAICSTVIVGLSVFCMAYAADTYQSSQSTKEIIQKQSYQVLTKEIKKNKGYALIDVKVAQVSGLKNKNVEKRINRLLQDKATEFIDRESQSAKYLYKQDKSVAKPTRLVSAYDVTYKGNDLISIVIENTTEGEGQYSYTLTEGYTVDLKTGKTVLLSQLFDEKEDYQKVIKKFIDKELQNSNPKMRVSSMYIQDQDLTFYLKDDYVVINLEPYQLEYLEKTDNSPGKGVLVQVPFGAFQYGFKTTVDFKPYAVDIQTQKIVKDDESIMTNISIPVISGLADERIQNQLNKKFKEDIMKFQKENEQSAKEYLEEDKAGGYEARMYAAYVTDVSFQEMKNEGNILSILVSYCAYTGGAHGSQDDVAYNIDLKTGKEIKLKDLFKEGYDYKKAIDQKIQKSIDDLTVKLKKEALIKGENPKEVYNPYQGFDGIAKDQKFYLKDDKLVVYFGQYEIAPYAAGIPTFEIYFSKLEDGLK
jgi:hypothetical protein